MQEKKEILRNPVRNGFLDPKNKFLKTGICNLADAEHSAPHGHFLVVVIVVGGSAGGAPVATVAGRGGSDGRGSGGGDNNMFCCGMWSVVCCVFGLVAV